MGEASHKQQAFPLLKVKIQIVQEVLVHISCNGLGFHRIVNLVDGLYLHLRRVVGNRRLVHQSKFNGFPVVGIPLFRRIPGQLIFSELPQEMQIMAIEDDLHIGMFCDVIYVLCGNVRPV